MSPLRIRWLGRVDYTDALAVQRALWTSTFDHLLLLEHPPVYTMGPRTEPANLLVDPAEVAVRGIAPDAVGSVSPAAGRAPQALSASLRIFLRRRRSAS